MEKSRPHYSLADVQAVVAAKGLGAFTQTAVFNGLARRVLRALPEREDGLHQAHAQSGCGGGSV